MSLSLENKKITVMGLGLHGGGSASARFFAEAGAEVTVTDLRPEEVLRPSIDALSDLPIRFVLGRHDEADFRNADIVIKNPAVPASSPYLAAAKQVETDISVFLGLNKRPVIAVTGSKGKSTIVSAVHWGLLKKYPDARLGGNITVSPLSFFSESCNSGDSPIVLELSSWQLADLAGRKLLKPKISVISNIMHDHQDKYSSMQAYADDKAVIFENQDKEDTAFFNPYSDFTPYFISRCKAEALYFTDGEASFEKGAYLDGKKGYWLDNNGRKLIIPPALKVPGRHNRLNLLCAAAVLYRLGMDSGDISDAMASFPGVPHRLEFIRELENTRWYNDSAATIPEAAAAAIGSFNAPVHIITGGTDKELDFSVQAEACRHAASVTLLAGTGSDKLAAELKLRRIHFSGPYSCLEDAVDKTRTEIRRKHGREQIALLSPGCASFGMFRNEFDRGDKFRKLVLDL